MKKLIAILFLFLLPNNFSQTSILPQFSELKGITDQQNNTYLFFRIYTAGYRTMGYYYSNNIWRLEPISGTDSCFLIDGGFSDQFDEVNSLEFWNSDYRKYIYAGTHIYFEPLPKVFRYDQLMPIFEPQIWAVSRNIELSKQDTNRIILSISNGLNYKTTDWGINWNSISYGYEILSLSPLNDNILFANQSLSLQKSTDGGDTFWEVDTGKIYEHNFIYDNDGIHIYALNKRFGCHLEVSNNQGAAFSWQTKHSSDSEIFLSNDEAVSGTIYLADKKNIFVTTDYGNNFSLYKTLDRNIVGIYKKPNSDKLYAATDLKIYELTPDSVKVIKKLSNLVHNFNWFPLEIGNYWVYSIYTSNGISTVYHGDETRAIIGSTTLSNGLKYFLYKRVYLNGNSDTTFIRLDSATAKIYGFSFSLGQDLLFDNLSAGAGDTVCYEFNPAWSCQYVQPEEPFQLFGLDFLIKKYLPQAPGSYFGHSLLYGIGLYETYNGDITTFHSKLNGCKVAGIVFGDTTVVAADDEELEDQIDFQLSQNYPNPFNPSTRIQYQVSPGTQLNWGASSGSYVTLKVYDVLGNEVATLVNDYKPAGTYEVEFSAKGGQESGIRNLASGIYFYRLKVYPAIGGTGDYVATKKMLLLR